MNQELPGWAQVGFPLWRLSGGRKKELWYDLYYVKNRRFALDLLIVLKTIWVVVRGDGAR